MPDMGGLMAMEEAVKGMTVDELYASLEEIESLDLDGRAEQMLSSAVLGELVKKDPEGVVKRFFGPDLGPRDPNQWVVGNAFMYWAMEAPEAAQAWFDERIAAGDFEGKTLDGSNPLREQFERAVIGWVLAGDPTAAEERLLALPEVERARVLALGNYTELPRKARPAMAGMVRKYLPEDWRLNALSGPAMHTMSKDGYAGVTDYLDDIGASREERRYIAEDVAPSGLGDAQGRVKPDAIGPMHEWLQEVAPEDADGIAGSVLGNLWSETAEARVGWVEGLLANGAGDEVLVGFLTGEHPIDDGAEAQRLAGRIKDPARRAEVLDHLKGGGK